MPIELYDYLAETVKLLLPVTPGQVRLSVPDQPVEAGGPARAPTSDDMPSPTRSAVVWDVLSRHLLASDLRLVRVSGSDASIDIHAGVGALTVEERRGACAAGDDQRIGLCVRCAPFSVARETDPQELPSGIESEALRYVFLNTHYRLPLTLSCEIDPDSGEKRFPQLVHGEAQVGYLYATERRLRAIPEARIVDVDWLSPVDIEGVERALALSLDADLNTPLALAHVMRFLVAVNALCDLAASKKGKVARSHVDDATEGFATIVGRLGLGAEEPSAFLDRVRNRKASARGISQEIVEGKIRERAAARAERKFDVADAILAELTGFGVTLIDGAAGTTWTVG